MTTEKQAMTEMVCPKTLSFQHPKGKPCIGQTCMHWRWLRQEHIPDGKDRVGYCGGAGRTD